MKKRRKVEVRIEHHEVSIYSLPPAAPGQGAVPFSSAGANSPATSGLGSMANFDGDFANVESDSVASDSTRPASCPVCGSAEMLLLAEALAVAGQATASLVASLKDGLVSGKYHLHCSASGQWWVCGQSIHSG